jgi:hypothetical protein
MARSALRQCRQTERTLPSLQRRGPRKGLYGSSRFWFWVGVTAWGLRKFRDATGAVPSVVFRDELRPGEIVQLSHKTETYAGKQVRNRRRKPVA